MTAILVFNPSRRIVYLNTAGLKLLPDMNYALLVISHEDKRLNIFPCEATVRDALPMRSIGKSINKPRHSRCREDFANKLMALMGWQGDCKYKMRGELALHESDTILTFDLASAEASLYET